MGSDLSARVLETCLADFERGGPTARLLAVCDGHARVVNWRGPPGAVA